MSYFDYKASRQIAAEDHPFFALIMAAMRQADTNNLALLKAAFPETWAELDARYNAAGGMLPGEVPADVPVRDCDRHGVHDAHEWQVTDPLERYYCGGVS